MSAISWNSGGVEHSEVFSIGVDNEVSADRDGAGLVNLGGYLTQISAGLDDSGNPEIYGIGSNNAVWVNHLNGGGWSSLGGNVTAISASNLNTVFAISGNYVQVNLGGGWDSLGDNFLDLGSGQISAGLTSYNTPEVYVLGGNGAVYADSSLNSAGWNYLGVGFTSISATSDNTVFAIGTNNAVYADYGYGFYSEGGYVLQISAGTDTYGLPEVYGIGSNNAAFVNDEGKGWVGMGGYVSDLAASSNNDLFVRGEIVSQIYSDTGSGFNYLGDMPIVEPWTGTSYAPANDSIKLYSNGSTGTPSYRDVEQGVTGDCWLLASLAEVAVRDPQDIENMFTQEPSTTAPNGTLVSNYQVRFFKPNGSAFSVEVDSQIPSGDVGDQVSNDLGTSSLWVALAEKAYVEANALGFVDSGSENNGIYAALNEGYVNDALQAITGEAANYYGISPTNIASAWNAGDLIVLATNPTTPPPSSYLLSGHAYAVVGYNASNSEPFLIFNPWGTDSSGWAPGHSGTTLGLFTANASAISEDFVGQSIGTGAANLNDTSGAFDGPDDSPLVNETGGHASTIKNTVSPSVPVEVESPTGLSRPTTAIDDGPAEALYLDDLFGSNETPTQQPMTASGVAHPRFVGFLGSH